MTAKSTIEHYQSVFLGCAIGDALGMPVEGMKPTQIQKYVGRITEFIDPVEVRNDKGALICIDEFGKLGYYNIKLFAGEYTDDTIRTIALAESLIHCKEINLEDIAQRQLAEYTKRLRKDGTVKGGFGGTTIAGFKNLQAGKSYQESGVIGGPGNAPGMMMHPLGLYMDTKQVTEGIEKILQAAIAIGKITHLDPRSLASGVVQAHAIYGILNGNTREDFLSAAEAVCRRFEQPATQEFSLAEQGSLLERLEWTTSHQDVSTEEAHQHLGSGSKVYSSYPFALFMMQKYWDDPVEGLIATVNYGGDCDTTGAIFGALAGARHGLCWPKEWMETVQNGEYLKKLGSKMWEMKRE
ncbi:ADP-ribosylglycohydrolase family protein [Candidatus Woesearchaeota archaeon]|nr:ADP-ribosylglycohydrolase family protein [Candidatus Woesearchaeota archaeon]